MLEALQKNCARLGVQLYVADCVEAFTEAVIKPFVASYASGATPNPCAACNAAMKFGLLLDMALARGADRLATGHYARIIGTDDGMALYAASDASKDQSYFLSLVPRERLAKAFFPLADMRKGDIRAWLAVRGLVPPEPMESQELCFVPHDEYRAFVPRMAERFGIPLSGSGPVVTPDGRQIGMHKGLWQYTEGQRRGLGIAWSEPLYVCGKDMDGNRLIVGGIADLHSGAGYAGNNVSFACGDMNFLVPPELWPQTVFTRTRYRQEAKAAVVRFAGSGAEFTETLPGGPFTPGQLATVYAAEDGGGGLRVLGGGIIRAMRK